MTALALKVLDALATERQTEGKARCFVSGADLAQRFGVTRSAVWKAIQQLRNWGTEIEALRNQGYRLAAPASPLSAESIGALLNPAVRRALRSGECAGSITSTNSLLLERGAPPAGRFDYLIAEHQHAGRGRAGRSWLAAPGSALCMSWSWCFEAMGQQMGALSLAVGVACHRALAQLGVEGVQLKWPNDLVAAQGKIGGILIELRTESSGPVQAVVGLGLNLALSAAQRQQILATGNRASDIASLCSDDKPPVRNALAAAILNHNILAMGQFAREGFAPFSSEFADLDTLRDLPIQLHGQAGIETGLARGIDADGALLVEHAGRVHRIISGDVSVRAATK
jgi:BirA family transcriptional regulator, biotin operon repressor / biotin---[acetyl-CoA-carboxylase] ligase